MVAESFRRYAVFCVCELQTSEGYLLGLLFTQSRNRAKGGAATLNAIIIAVQERAA